VYKSDDEIIEHGHVIIYILHEDIGHLGIFVSGSVAKRNIPKLLEILILLNTWPQGFMRWRSMKRQDLWAKRTFSPVSGDGPSPR
jgi:hypothetical protein